jgi:2-oxoglutarate ferredoxin oxidoreductase subunit alpha
MDVNVRIAGEAGQGVQTTGNLLVGALARAGLHVFASQSYMSRIRGGLNWFDIRLGHRELFSGRRQADLLVALTAEALEALRGQLAPGGVALFDGSQAAGAEALPFTEAAKQTGGSALMANTVAAGAVFAVLGLPLDDLCAHLEIQFKKKDREVVEKNLLCARRGAELACSLARPWAWQPRPRASSSSPHTR